MSFLTPKVPAPPPVEPPPPAPAVPDPVVPDSAVSAEGEVQSRRRNRKRVNRQATILTGQRGLLTEAPVEYKSLIGRS